MAKPTRYTQDMVDTYMSQGYWDVTRTAELWDRCASLYPDEEALVDSENRLTWGQVKLYSDRFALGLLEMGFKKDDMLVMQLPNCVESFIVRIGCEKAGVLCTTPMITLRHLEMESIMKAVDAMAVVIPVVFRDFDFFQMITELKPRLPTLKHVFVIRAGAPPGAVSLKDMLERPIEKSYPPDHLSRTCFSPFEFAIVGNTSGTTGIPKTAERPMQAQIAIARGIRGQFNPTHDDVIFCGANVVAGLGAPGVYFGTAPMVGAKVIMMERWDPGEGLKILEKERPTALFAVPPQLVAMLDHPDFHRRDLSSLRVVISATAVLRYEIAAAWEKRIQPGKVLEFYGTFDAGGMTGQYLDDPQEVRFRSIGRPFPGNKVKILDDNGNEMPPGKDGEIVFQGACLGSGYYRNLEATKKAWGTFGLEGWYHTGDLGRMDEQGNVYIVGRKADIIIRGGQNIYPLEIEEILVKHPKVADAAVVAMPDRVMGEKACAFVEPKPGMQITADELIAFLKEQKLATYKLPERFEFKKELPRVRDGKIPKKLLREEVVEKLKAEGKGKL